MSADPITLAAIFTAVGAVTEGVGALQASSAQASAQEFDAAMADRQAQVTRREAAMRTETLRRDAMRTRAAQRAGAAAQGRTISGSVLGLLMETSQEQAFEAMAIRFGADEATARLRAQAAFDRQAAGDTRRAGFMSAGASLLSGAGAGYQLYSQAAGPAPLPSYPVTPSIKTGGAL